MQSNESKHFNITLNEDEILTFDTNIEQPVILLKVIAAANAIIVDALTKTTGRDDIIDILVQETAEALKQMKEYKSDEIEGNEGGETNESN